MALTPEQIRFLADVSGLYKCDVDKTINVKRIDSFARAIEQLVRADAQRESEAHYFEARHPSIKNGRVHLYGSQEDCDEVAKYCDLIVRESEVRIAELEAQIKGLEIRHTNLCLDVQRVANSEQTLCSFHEVEAVESFVEHLTKRIIELEALQAQAPSQPVSEINPKDLPASPSLPPLPTPEYAADDDCGQAFDGYSEDQMLTYAQLALQSIQPQAAPQEASEAQSKMPSAKELADLAMRNGLGWLRADGAFSTGASEMDRTRALVNYSKALLESAPIFKYFVEESYRLSQFMSKHGLVAIDSMAYDRWNNALVEQRVIFNIDTGDESEPISTTSAAPQDAQDKKDAELLDYLTKMRIGVHPIFHTQYDQRTDGSGFRDQRLVFDGWTTGISDPEFDTPREAIKAAIAASKQGNK